MNGGQPARRPQFVSVPAQAAWRIARVSTVTGVVAGVLSVVALPALIVFPYLIVPDDEQLRIWLPLTGVGAAGGAVAAAVGAWSARSWVGPGYLDLDKVRSTRSLLRAACTITTLTAATAGDIYLRIVSAAESAARFDWTYLAALMVVILLPYLPLVALRLPRPAKVAGS